ncbi:MAG: hypothetical protein ACREQL_03500 [Candidatus Binatia bacterium]
MRTSWTGPIIAVGATVLLIGAGGALAKHDDHGSHGSGSHGHGGPHGGPGNDSGNGPGHGGGNGNGGSGACEAASSGIMAFVDATCPCAGADDGNGGTVPWKNHGQYVRCITHAVRDAARTAGVRRRCARGLVPCAARSSCGKNGAVACVVAATGTCTNGACSNDAATACTTDADCPTRTCSVTRADDCATSGGAASSGSCCTASPSGAFVE